MRKSLMTGIVIGLLTGMSVPSKAQSGFINPIRTQESNTKVVLPKINLPKPEWAKISDIQDTDGTVAVPSCGDINVIVTVRDGIINMMNEKYEANGGRGSIVKKADLGEIWVKPTYSGRFVCNMSVQLDLPFTRAEEWQFQTIARNGKSSVAFFNLSSRR